MFIIYDLIFLFFMLLYLPYAVFRGKFHKGLISRLGFLPGSLKFNHPIWLHAVSVGEVLATKQLLAKMYEAYPNKQVVISTVTTTGNKIARTLAREKDFVFYLPFDLSFIVKKVINKINPHLFIVAETEIWPNLISYLKQRGIAVVLVNARLSDKSYRRYKCIYYLLKPILNKIDLICVQTQTDAQRFISLGAGRDKVKITGNMKFDAINAYTDFKKDYIGKLNLAPADKLWVCGSTHPGEEKIILKVYRKLLTEFPNLKLLIAPRHPERAKNIERLVGNIGFMPAKVSQLLGSQYTPSRRQTVFILDTVGELLSSYSIADIIFVGGSLFKKGGHNIIEPAFFAKPIIIGPYYFNFRDITHSFLKESAVIVLADRGELEEALRRLLKDKELSEGLGNRAKKLVEINRGVSLRTFEIIKTYINGAQLYL